MRLQIELRKIPKGGLDSPLLVKFRERLSEVFSTYQPRRLSEDPASYDCLKHEMIVPEDDTKIEGLLAGLDNEIRQTQLPVAATFKSFLSTEEIKRARFLHLYVYGDSVDRDSNHRPLNPIKHVLCASCKFPDTSKIPKPLLVSKAVLKKQDVFLVSTGMLVVRSKVLQLLKHAIKDQIEFGEAVVVQGKKGAVSNEKLFWVRPKEMVGNELGKRFPKTCPVCERPLESRVYMFDDRIKKRGPGLYDDRSRLEHFGGGKSDIALINGYYGEIQNDGMPRWHWTIAISGALFTFLKKNGVKGIAASAGSDPVECFASAQGDLTLEPIARIFEEPSNAIKNTIKNETRIQNGRKTLALMKNLPWDYDKDGYVYFYLTTPELIVVDPMTWEEDAGGPYLIKNFTKPGVYRLPVSAIKSASGDKRGVAVDSATLLFVDNAFFSELQDAFDWEKSTESDGTVDSHYCNEIAEEIGSRFGVCTPPPEQFKSSFAGDGCYGIDAKRIRLVN